MLSLSKSSFKVRQPLRDTTGPKNPKAPDTNVWKSHRRHSALQCIPGEDVLEEASQVRKSVPSPEGGGCLPGTLYCTNLRVAFRPDPPPGTEGCPCHPVVHSDHDVALPCIAKLVAVNSFTKAKVLSGSSLLKFIPEELLIYCRDFRLLRFHFHESGLEPKAFRVTMAIAQAQEERGGWDGSHEDSARKDLENGQPKGEEGVSPTLLFEAPGDWEEELQRMGAGGWRVSPANERFDMSTSLPKYLPVPSRILDNELKKAFVHFNERRIPRLSWHRPGGSDLLRAASFHPESDPEKEDMRSVETLMLAGHGQCVLVESAAELPAPAEVQQSYSRLWALSLSLADSSVAPSDEKWLSALEGTRWLDHVRACLKKASQVAVLLAERRRSVVLQESDDRDLNCLLASLVQVLSDPHARTLPGFQSLVQKEWVAAGHPFQRRLNLLQKNDQDESPVFLLFLDCVWQVLRQFPPAFEFTEAYLVALHDSAYLPFASTFLFNCQWERGRRSQQHGFLNQLYTPINSWRETLPLEILQEGVPFGPEGGAACSPPVWDWAARYGPRQRANFRNPFYQGSSPAGSGSPCNGNFLPQNGDQRPAPGKGALYVFSKGSLTLQPPFFPWKNGSVAKKGARRAPTPEGLPERSRRLRPGPGPLCQDGPLLLPSLAGPGVALWQRCYLRGNPGIPLGLFAPTLLGLAEELELLQQQLRAAEKELRLSS